MKKKLLSLVLAVAMLFSLAIPAFADEAEAAAPYTVPADVAGKVVILHTNDVHGAIENYAKVATLKKMFADAGAEVLLVDAGDFSQGETYVSVSEGKTAVELMNLVGYEVAAPGNHEFDYGYENLKELEKLAQFPILCANIVDAKGEPLFQTGLVTDTKIGKIGIFGLDTPETATKAHPAKIKGLTFLGSEELYECAALNVKNLKDEGAEFILCLSHLGIDDESKANGNRSIDMLDKVEGIDLLIDGHSHSTLEAMKEVTDGTGKVGNTVVTSTGTKIANVGVVIIDADKNITTENVPVEAITGADETVAAAAQAVVKEVEDLYGATFGKSNVALNGERAPGNRTEETNLGDLITDAMVWQVTKDGGLDVDNDHVVAITNGGGIRAAIAAGDITRNDVNKVLPFGNTVATVYITGEAMLEALEASTFCTPTAVGGFPQVSGINFTIDTAAAFDAGENYEGTTYAKPNSINRVTVDSVNGKDFDPTATYAVVTNDFMAAGGDTYFTFTTSDKIVDTGVPMDEALMAYITEELKGEITEAYAAPQGRITVKYVGVEPGAWYTAAAKNVIDKGIMKATTGGSFDPNGIVTRATVFQTLYNMEGKPAVETAATFSDVAAGVWYADAAAWAQANGLAQGTGDNTFNGDRTVTRAELVVALERYAKLKGVDTVSETNLLTYADGETLSEYSVDAFKWAVGTGMIQGKNGNLLDPAGTAVRSELAQILTNYTAAPWGAAVLLGQAASISKYGNVTTDIPYGNLGVVGIAVGDILKVEITGQKALELPLGTGYSNVDQGSPLALADTSTGTLALAINRGDFATTYGLGTKGDSGYAITEGVEIKISLAQKGGYLAEMEVRELDSKRTNSRDDYASDEVFANFRPITVGNIAEGVLYRTSSPVNPELGRNAYADKLIENAGVKTIVNLADCRNTIAEYEGFADTYYAKQNYVCLNMGVDMYAADAIEDLKNGLEFMVENPGPYAFHCTEGKDRAGYYAMLLEALMGATVQDIVADYMLSFENYYFVKADTEQWSKIAASNIEKDLIKLTGTKDIVEAGEADLAAAAEKYMIETIGLTQEQVNTLKTNLSTPIGA